MIQRRPKRRIRRRAAEWLFVFGAALAAMAGAAETGDWPALPEKDGAVSIPAQEWPRGPGSREITVYVRYPGGERAGVTPQTGLMLSLHNWGGTDCAGAPEPKQLVARYNVVAISVDYLQSGPYEPAAGIPYDFGWLQALDALRALYYVFHGLDQPGRPFARDRIFATGGSGGGNVALMANKLAPRTFTCVIDICGMAKLSDDIAFGRPGRTHLNAGYSPDPASPAYLTADEQAIRFIGHPEHCVIMKQLRCRAKIIIVHGTDDEACPVEDAREMAANMAAAGLDVEAHFITEADLDGKALTGTGHSLGDRTRIVFRFGDNYLLPGGSQGPRRTGATDFECRDAEVCYATPNGRWVISYAAGFPVARFQRDE